MAHSLKHIHGVFISVTTPGISLVENWLHAEQHT